MCLYAHRFCFGMWKLMYVCTFVCVCVCVCVCKSRYTHTHICIWQLYVYMHTYKHVSFSFTVWAIRSWRTRLFLFCIVSFSSFSMKHIRQWLACYEIIWILVVLGQCRRSTFKKETIGLNTIISESHHGPHEKKKSMEICMAEIPVMEPVKFCWWELRAPELCIRWAAL